MQKIMKLCDCPKDICRADSPTETCRFIVDPHDRLRLDIAKNFGPVVAKEKKHWADEFNDAQQAKDKRIADLERQLAEKQAEIEAMRPTLIKEFPGKAVEEYRKTHNGRLPSKEQETKKEVRIKEKAMTTDLSKKTVAELRDDVLWGFPKTVASSFYEIELRLEESQKQNAAHDAETAAKALEELLSDFVDYPFAYDRIRAKAAEYRAQAKGDKP